MTKELLDKANILNNKVMYVSSLLEDIKENNSPITIQTGMAHNFQLDYPREMTSPLDERTYNLITDILESYCSELKREFDMLTEGE